MSRQIIRQFGLHDMILTENSPELQYRETQQPNKKNQHLGQLKLLLADQMGLVRALLHICEIAAIANTANTPQKNLQQIKQRQRKVAVLVVGAAIGNHFVNLCRTFYFLDFFLYDPAPQNFCPDIVTMSEMAKTNVFITRTYFYQSMAKEWKAGKELQHYKHFIFLCDLRCGDGKNAMEIQDDMKLQHQITQELCADYSVLKFRPPFYFAHLYSTHKAVEYFDGTVFVQPFAPNNSTETRLHVTDVHSIKMYNPRKYQNQLFYHNRTTRDEASSFLVQGRHLQYDEACLAFATMYIFKTLHLRVENTIESAHEKCVTERPVVQNRPSATSSEASATSTQTVELDGTRPYIKLVKYDVTTQKKIHNYTYRINEATSIKMVAMGVYYKHKQGVQYSDVETLNEAITTSADKLCGATRDKSYDVPARVLDSVMALREFLGTIENCLIHSKSQNAVVATNMHKFQLLYLALAYVVAVDLSDETQRHLQAYIDELYMSCNILYNYACCQCALRDFDEHLVNAALLNRCCVDISGESAQIAQDMPKIVPPRTDTANRKGPRDASPDRNKQPRTLTVQPYVPPHKQFSERPPAAKETAPPAANETAPQANKYVPPHLRRLTSRQFHPEPR